MLKKLLKVRQKKEKLKPGEIGEELAAKHLKSKGWQIIDRNFQSKFGEIDIIALEASRNKKTRKKSLTLVFVEVKTRWSKEFGSPEEAITPWKIQRMTKAAHYYKILHPQLPDSLRLDAVVIDMTLESPESIRVICNITQ
ncbi:YraN family protein [Patescibacteria group bacterium]